MEPDAILTCHMARTPLGLLRLSASEDGLTEVIFPSRAPSEPKPVPRTRGEAQDHLRAAVSQLTEYFNGKRTRFQLQLDLRGTDFDCEVWQMLLKIPCGKTRTYGQLAKELGAITLARAVGGACGRNPISIVVPCHRVIGADSSLTGYGGGVSRKEKLLRLEGASFAAPQLDLF